MWRRPLLPLAAIAALALSAAAQAQETPAAPPAAAPSHRTYSPEQMNGFARATVELQNLGSQDPEAMTRTIQSSGMSVEDYNQMGDAMRADPALATSLNPYLDSANSARAARIYAARAPSSSGDWTAPSRHATSSRTAGRYSHSSRHAPAHTRTPHHGHATAPAHHHATKTASHHAATSRHHASAPAHHAAASHTTRRHRHS